VTTAPVLDTHAWIWWVDGDPRLPRATSSALDALPASDRPVLCDISLWEVAMLVERRRLSLAIPFESWLEAAAHPRSVRIQPVTTGIAAEVARLPSTFHRDPADRLIVATCRVLGAPLVSKDRLITGSRLVTAWRPGAGRAGR
jgi:PIN domain nuclease of toxin-antitoxin system